MKFVTSIAVVALATIGSVSFASGVNLVSCPWNDQDDEITIRQDVGGQLVALFSMLDHGTTPYSVKLKPVKSGMVGAGETYEGHGLTLHINTDGPGGTNGFDSTLTITDLSIRNEKFTCTLLN